MHGIPYTWLDIVVAVLLLITKLADAVTTMHCLNSSAQETNPFARHIMGRIGSGKAVWFIFALAAVIIVASLAVALHSGPLMQAAFIAVGFPIAIVQAAVAHCNWTGRNNRITRQIFRFHAALNRLRLR